MKINTRPTWLQRFNPDLTIGLFAVIVVLALFAVGSFVGIAAGVFTKQPGVIMTSALTMAMYLVPAWGLYRLKRWARFMQLFLSIMSLISGFITMFSQNMGLGVLTIVIHGLIAIYLLTDDCRRSFGFTV